MNNIIIRTCLFWRYNGKYANTWQFFADNVDDNYRRACIAQLEAWHMNSIIFLMNNSDPDGIVSFYKGGEYGGEVDEAKLSWAINDWIKPLYERGAKLIPCWWCDNDGNDGLIKPYNKPENTRHVQGICQRLAPYAAGHILGIESNEYFSTGEINEIILFAEQFTILPIGIHEQWKPDKRGFPGKARFLAYEHEHDPNDGDSISPEQCASEAAKIAFKCGKPCIWSEYNTNTEDQRIREQTRALAEVSNTVGIGGPW